jgi:hypothetical protein
MPWAPDYVDSADLAEFVRTASDNPYVGTYGTAASRAVDDWTSRQFGQLAAPATFNYRAHRAASLPDDRWLLLIDDIADTTAMTVTVDGTLVAAGVSGYQLWPDNAVAKGGVYTGITLATAPTATVDVFARFGWSAIPAAVTASVWLQVNRWHERRESPYGVAGSPNEGSEIRLGSKLDPDVRAMLAYLTRSKMPQ